MSKINDIDNVTLPVYKRLRKVIDEILPQLGNINVKDLPIIEDMDNLTIEDVNRIKGKIFYYSEMVFYPVYITDEVLYYVVIADDSYLTIYCINYSDESNIILTYPVSFPLAELKYIYPNPELPVNPILLKGLEIGNTKYKLFNPDDSGIFYTPPMQYGYDSEGSKYYAYFSRMLSSQEYNRIPDSGLAIIMFNTTCVCIPYSKAKHNRFVCNAIYDNNGNSMIVRGKLAIEEGIGITFDENYAQTVDTNMMNKPSCIVRFLGI